MNALSSGLLRVLKYRRSTHIGVPETSSAFMYLKTVFNTETWDP